MTKRRIMPIRNCIAIALLLIAPAAFAQTPDPCASAPQSCATLINTHATAQTRIPSTAVDISVGITGSDKDMASVQRLLAQRSSALLTYLRAEKVQRLVTNAISFSPSTKSQKSGPDKTVGYDGSLSVSFRTTPDKAPEILAGVLDHGANNIDSSSFTPTEDEIAATRRDLSAEATRTAIAQGESIAKAAGLHMVAVRTINVEADSPFTPKFRTYSMAAPMAAQSSPAIDTAAGEQAFSMRVDVTIAATH